MADPDSKGGGSVHSLSEGGVAATHPEQAPHPLKAGSTTEDQFNTYRPALFPIACWRLHDIRFDFDSSFILPAAKEELSELAALRKLHPGAPMSIFGHADSVGPDDYNKELSGRRARALYALLTRDPDTWEELHNAHGWGVRSVQFMLNDLGFYDGPISENQDKATTDAISKFQATHNLDSKGVLGPKTRHALFLDYMNDLCGEELKPATADFLAQGLDVDVKGKIRGKGDFQGCGDFNPLMVFSEKENKEFKKAANKQARDDANAPNRRVVVFLFRPGSFVHFQKWPCPRVSENEKGCSERFWSDGDDRRHKRLENARRIDQEIPVDADTGQPADTELAETFACRFYDRISNNSPCEQMVRLATLRIRLIDDRDLPYQQTAYRFEVGAMKFEGVTTEEGVLEHRIPVSVTVGKLTVVHRPNEDETGGPVDLWTLDLEIVADLGGSDTTAGAQARLNNLGLFAGAGISGQLDEQTQRALQRFQMLYRVKDGQGNQQTDGKLQQDTVDRLKEIYGS